MSGKRPIVSRVWDKKRSNDAPSRPLLRYSDNATSLTTPSKLERHSSSNLPELALGSPKSARNGFPLVEAHEGKRYAHGARTWT
ncbi:unnamed protein product [Echinostoma caproni]|uniref:Uncharacterized protein n=1 Tax=Echinostoma caproni TaxID=27848 RepID=A0A183AS21_9TREM|nr:unnamed protein product [Echinostoma caproni]